MLYIRCIIRMYDRCYIDQMICFMNDRCTVRYNLNDRCYVIDVYWNRLVYQMLYVDDKMYVRCLLYAGQMV